MWTTDPLRVGYVVKMYPRYSETFIVTELLAHEEAGLPVEIFSLRPTDDTHFQDAIARVRAPVHYLPAEGLKAAGLWTAIEEASRVLPGLWGALEAARGEEARYVYQAVRLAHEAHRRGIRHLHAHFASSATTVARLAARFAGLPYTVTAHAKDIFHESVEPDDLRRKLGDAATVVTVSDYNLAYLRETYGPAAARVQRIYNGLDLERFPYASPADRPPQIVGVGRLVEKKGFADLIDACAHLTRRGRDFGCQIIGTGELADDLRARIERLGVQDRVQLTGPRPQSELRQHLHGAAVFAAPCIHAADGNRDGLPTVLLEAMALGVPCVSTDVTGIPEVVRDNETGLQVPQRDPAGLARAIERLLDDADLRVRLATQARRLIESEFDIRRNTVGLRAIFQAAAEADRRPPADEDRPRPPDAGLLPAIVGRPSTGMDERRPASMVASP
jgi:colanic acid/amylovoran biosynthesis glycosyltransferase